MNESHSDEPPTDRDFAKLIAESHALRENTRALIAKIREKWGLSKKLHDGESPPPAQPSPPLPPLAD